MISSTSIRNSAQLCWAAMGTATRIRLGPCIFNAWAAAFMLAPVARPSSTTITVRPAIGTRGLMRLLTEAEWEYAARAGTTGARYGDLDQVAWYGGPGHLL